MIALVAAQAPWAVAACARLSDRRSKFGESWIVVEKVEDMKKAIDDLKPWFIFFAHWNGSPPKDALAKTTCVGLCPAPLPYGRGGSGSYIENMLLRGHVETTLTAYRITQTSPIDAGPIYSTFAPIPIVGDLDEIHERMIEPAVELMSWVAKNRPEPIAQNDDRVVEFARMTADEREKFWADPAVEIDAFGAVARAKRDEELSNLWPGDARTSNNSQGPTKP